MNIMWRAKIKGQKHFATDIPLHMSLKTFDKPEEVSVKHVVDHVNKLNIPKPQPHSLSFEPVIFKAPKTGLSYYMLKVHGVPKEYEQAYNELHQHGGIVYPSFMGHITIDKPLFDKINKEGLKPEEVEFEPLSFEHGNKLVHRFNDK